MGRHFSRAISIVGVLAISMSGAFCAPGPSGRGFQGGPVEAGPGSLEAVRRQLSGTWELVSYESLDPAGQATSVPASGRMTYDQFGNFSVEGQIDRQNPTGGTAATEMLNVEGHASIDVANSRLLIQSMAGNIDFTDPDFASAAPENFRHYEFAGDQLITTVMDANGDTIARLTWRQV